MSIDLEKSFSFPFKDPEWPQKIITGGLFFLGSFLLNFLINYFFFRDANSRPDITRQLFEIGADFVITIPIMSFAIGYILQSAHNEINDELPLLPDWDANFSRYFRQGIMFYFVTIGYYLILTLILFLLIIILKPILTVTGSISQYQTASTLMGIIVGLLFFAISPFIAILYARDFNWKDGFRINEIISIITKAFPEYLAGIGISIVLWIGWIILYIILSCTCIGILIPPFLTLPVYLITLNIFSQVYKRAQVKE